MVTFKLSAFADEYSPEFDKQLEGLKNNAIGMIEIRGVDGKNISELSLDKARVIRKKLDDAGIAVSAIGSPVGKIKITDDIEPHLELVSHIIEIAKILGTKRIRMFSFYIPQGDSYESHREEVLRRLEMMLKLAEKNDIELCHENEKGIYGDTPERCLDILTYFNGRLKGVYDHANFIDIGSEAYPYAYNLLKDHITYFHIKDSDGKDIRPAGEGKGRIPETIADIKKDYEGEIVLTLEPHLFSFVGLSELEGTDEKIEKPYQNSEEAFSVAVTALKNIL